MPARLLKFSRVFHLYFGVFITPAILFFALTGALQTFGLHETNRDHPDYKPARWIVILGQLHKKQTTIVPVRKPQAPPAGAPSSAIATISTDRHQESSGNGDHEGRGKDAGTAPDKAPLASAPASAPLPQPKRHPLPLRIFFLIVSLGLFSATATGLYMSYKFSRNKALITATLLAGIIVPVVLVFV